MRSLDVTPITWPRKSLSHVTCSLTCMFPYLSHVTFTICIWVMAARLDSSLSCWCFLAYAFYSFSVVATRLSRTSLRPLVSRMIRLPVLVTPSLLPGSLPLYHSPNWTLFLSLTFTDSTPVCTCIVLTCIYTGLEMGRSPSSIYFATTLVLWPERSHVLFLDRSSSLAKAICFVNFREFPSVPSLTGSEVQPTQCTSVRS